MEGGKVMFALLGIVALCSLVAIIISAITLSRPSQVPTINLSGLGGGGATPVVMGGGGSCSGGQGGGKTYKIAVGHDITARSYIDDKGYLSGYFKELIAEVCGAAGISCVTVWDKWPNCWQTTPGEHSQGGKGLMGNWYDACLGWWKTVGRTMVFDFTEPFLKAPTDYLFIIKGQSIDPTKLTDEQAIGFYDGWAQDEKCLARYNITLKKKQVKYYKSTAVMQQKLHDGETVAFFSTDSYHTNDPNIVKLTDKPMKCALAGTSVMAPKASPFVALWNRGFNTIKTNGRYHRHCKEAWDNHGHKGGTLPCYE